MSSCNLPDYHKIAIDMLADGIPLNEVLNAIRIKAKLSKDTELLVRLNKALPQAQQINPLSEDEKTILATLWNELREKVSDDVLSSAEQAADVIISVLGEEKATQFITLLNKRGTDLSRRVENRRSHIEFLEKLRKVHANLGDEDLVAQLDEDIDNETERLKQQEQNSNALDNRTNGLLSKELLFRQLMIIAEVIDRDVMSETETSFIKEVQDVQQKLREVSGRMGAYVSKIKQMKAKIKTSRGQEKQDVKKRLKDFITENESKYKEDKKTFIQLTKQGKKLQMQELLDTIKDRTGKSLGTRNLEAKQFSLTLTRELEKIQAQLIQQGITSLASDAKDIKLTTEQLLSNRSRLQVVASEGAKIKIEGFIKTMDHFGTNGIGVNEAQEAFGEYAVKVIIRDREKLSLPDGTTSDDLSDLTIEELKKAAQIWKNQLISTYDGGFFTEDSALMTEESFNVIEAIALGKDVVDGSSPEAVDPTFPKTMNTQEIAANTNLGTIPTRNKFKTHRDAARALESSLRRLQTVFGYRYFDGFISEKLIRQVLHERLMDIHPKAWEEAKTKSKRARIISAVSQEEKLNLMRGMLTAHGADLNTMPEFTNPDWFTDNSKLISFDIETFGNTRQDEKIDGIYCVQIHRRDASDKNAIVSKTEIWVNDERGNLVDAKTTLVRKRQPLTPEQMTFLLSSMDQAQNDGFKVITHNGNDYDFGQLGKHVTDKNLLARVALRSIDTLANITSQVPELSWMKKSRQKGKKLKEIVKENLPDRQPTFGYADASGFNRIQFTHSFPVDLTTNQPIKLDTNDGIAPLWEEANQTGDWYKFDAYAENDADLTIGLYLHLADPLTTTIKLRGEEESTGRVISSKPAVSNLWLNNNSNSDSYVTPIDSLGSLGRLTPQLESIIQNTYFVEEVGYDAKVVYDILTSWWLGTLLGDEKSNENKIIQLVSALRNQAAKETVFDEHHVSIADENRKALAEVIDPKTGKPMLKSKFEQFGFVLSLNYNPKGRNEDLVSINDNLDGTMPVVGVLNEEVLYRNNTQSAEVYEQTIIASFLAHIRQPEIKARFFKALEQNTKVRKKTQEETTDQYWTSVITDFLKEHIPEFNALRQFGNGELDWKPANEVGIGIAQVIMDQKPGITTVDVLVQIGETLETLQVLDEQAALKNQQGRTKEYAMPGRNNVHMAQPHELRKEEIAYEGWKLKQRVRHVLRLNMDDKTKETIKKFLDTPTKQNVDDPISFFVREQVLRVLPDVSLRHPFAAIPNLDSKRQLIHEHLYQIPRLLMTFNHDCTYMGMKAPPRFLSGDLPVFYLKDFASAGGPTAAALIGGALDQLAHMTSYGLLSEASKLELERVLERGYNLLKTNGDVVFDRSNKSDYKYNGKHNILAMLIAFRENNFDIFNEMLEVLRVEDETGQKATMGSKKLIVAGKELDDPRFLCLDYLIGFNRANDKHPGFLNEIIANPAKFDMGDQEQALAVSIKNKLNVAPENVKELLKGAITPAFYQAGYPGILQGLTDKNNAGALGEEPLTEDELEFLALLITRSDMIGKMRIIDKAIGFTRQDLTKLSELLLKRAQVLNSETFSSTLTGSVGIGKAKSKAARFNTMQEWLNKSIEGMTSSLLRARFGTEEISPFKREKFENETKERLQKEYKTRLEEASQEWADKSTDEMGSDEYNTFIYKMNRILSGGDEAAKNHLLIFALNSRAATPYVLQDDVVDLHMFTTGVHIDKEDYIDYLNKEIYFRYGVETASGRNHMVAWYGLGPESSKYAQPRVKEGKEKNPYGIWDVAELPSEADFEALFYRQVLLDLSRFYKPPLMGDESRGKFFLDLEERSRKELQAAELSKYLEAAPKERTYTFNETSVQINERNKRNRKVAKTAYERARMRTVLPIEGDAHAKLSLDTKVDGFGALRGVYADIDFTQRGIYALTRAQHSMRIRNNRYNAIIKNARESASVDPNGFVSSNLRGYESGYTKNAMPHIPMSSTDLSAAISLGDISRQEQIAIKLQNVLTQFALTNGLDSLLENKDWARIYYIMKLRDKAVVPAIRSLRESSITDESGLGSAAAEEALREARIRFFDGFVKTVGISSITLSGLKRFSTLDLMADLNERRLTLEDIENITTQYGETPGWLQVLSYLSTNDKIERLMPLKFGVTIQTGLIARGKQGRKGIKETSNLPIVQFGREILQLYHIILSSKIAKEIATQMVNNSEYASDPNIQRDKSNNVILESIDPRKNPALYRQIWKAIIAQKQKLAVEALENYNFVVDNTSRLRILGKQTQILREDESSIPLTTQGPTDSYPQEKSQVDNPSTLWMFTPQGLIQMLNNLENYDLFADIELAIQTKKEIYGFETRLDQVVREENAQLFERMRQDEEEINEALLFLHEISPGATLPKILSDYRNVNNAGIPRRVLDVGSYLKTTRVPRSKSERAQIQEEGITNGVKISFQIPADATRPLNQFNQPYEPNPITVDYLIETADMPFVVKILQVINYANKAGFRDEALQLGAILKKLLDESTNPPKNVKTTNYAVKALSLTYEVFGNDVAEDNALRFVMQVKQITKPMRALQVEIKKAVELMNFVMTNEAHETKREYYVATALLEKMVKPGSDISKNADFIALVASSSGKPITRDTQKNIERAYRDLERDPTEAEVSNEEFNLFTVPTTFVAPENFINSFANPTHRSIASKLVDNLQDLVDQGIISQRAMDMKLMLIGSLSQHNPEIISELGFEFNSGSNGESLMHASKKNGRYTLGLNITAMKVTAENELIFRFAEELVHLARMKFIKEDSAEWRRVTGLYTSRRSEGMIREMLFAMNSNKPVENIEAQVAYAMENPDEFFAHMGAFFLLREVMDTQDAINLIEARFSTAAAGLNLWRKAFYKIKAMSKRIVTTFSKLQNDPYYSSLFYDAEEIVMSVIGKGLANRVDVQNPDAHFNAFKNASTTLENKEISLADIQQIRTLQRERKQLADLLETEMQTTRDSTKITTLTTQVRQKSAEIASLDAITFMGKTVSEVTSDIDKIHDFAVDPDGNIRRLTPYDLTRLRATRSFLTHLVTQGMKRRGERTDYGWSLGSGVRKLVPEHVVSQYIQNYALTSWNGSSLTYNSPFAPMIVLANLIDETSATTQGSFASDVGGIENMTYAIDPYTLNVMRLWSELTSEFPTNKAKHLSLLQDVVRYLHKDPNMPVQTTDPLEQQLVTSLAEGITLFSQRLVKIMNDAQLFERSHNLDKFPLRLRNFELLTPEARQNGYTAIKEKQRKKQLDLLAENRQEAPFSALTAYVGGIIPYNKGLIPDGRYGQPNDKDFTSKVLDDIQNGVETIANTGREAILNYIIREAVSNAARHASNNGVVLSPIDYLNTRGKNIVNVYKDSQDILSRILYRNRHGNVTMFNLFQGMSDQNMEMLVTEYTNILQAPHSDEVKARWTEISRDDELKARFNVPVQTIPILPQAFETMEAADILAIDLLSRCGVSSHVFDMDSFYLNSKDIFGNTTSTTDPLLLQVFDSGVDSLFKSLARNTGYDAIERIQVQRVTGIPGAFLNISQILDMFEQETSVTGNQNIHNFYLLNNKGMREHEDSKHKLMKQSLQRLRLALNDAKGTLTQNDLDQGSQWAWLNSAMKTAVLLRFGANINTATTLVEGVTSTFAAMSSHNNIFRGFIDAAFFVKDMANESLRARLNALHDSYIPGRNEQNKLKFFPNRRRKMRQLALNSLQTLNEATSPLLPQNLHASDPTSDVIEAMSFWDRFKLNRAKSNSTAMKSIRVAMDAVGNRRIMQLLRNKALFKFRQAYQNRNRPFTSQAEIHDFLRANKLTHIDLEVAIYIVRSGLLEGKRLDALDFARKRHGVWWNGVLLFQSLFDDEVLLGKQNVPASMDITPPPGMTKKQLREALADARASLSKFQDMNTTRGMVVKRSLDSIANDNLAMNILTFYKSYPTMFVAQQLLRRSTLSPLHKMAFQLILSAFLDFAYNVLLAMARGTLTWEDLEEKMSRKNPDWKEISRFLIRNPALTNNPLGALTNIGMAAVSGRGQGGIFSSVGEAALGGYGKDLFDLSKSLYQNNETWGEQGTRAYKVLGPILGDAYAVPIRIAVMQAWGVANTGSSGKSGNRSLEALYDAMINQDDALGNQTIRHLFPNYPTTLREQPNTLGIPESHQQAFINRLKQQPKTKPQVQPQVQSQTEQPKIPEVSTTKEPSIQEQATTPIKAPM